METFTTALITFYGTENTGVRHLAAALKSAGFPVHIIFFREWRNNDITWPPANEERILLDLLEEIKPQLVGFSFISSFLPLASRYTRMVKQRLAVPVIWGGIHATSCPEESLQEADYVCLGEGEEALLDLVRALSLADNDHTIANIWTRQGETLIKNPIRALVENLDRLPAPDHHPGGKYLIDHGRLIRDFEPISSGAEYRIYISRGCPYNCSYCYNSILRAIYRGKGKYYRYRSVDAVMAELAEVKARFPRLRRIKIDDDTSFAYDREWIEEFCRRYRDEIGVPFEALLHPDIVDQELLRKLQDAGLIKVQIGIEAASAHEAKEVFNRVPANEKVLKFAKMNRELGLEVVYDIIIDNPLATDEDRRQLLDFLLELPRPYSLYLYSLTVFPRTLLAENLLTAGVIKAEEIEGKNTKAWRQFRVSLDYPRPARERFWLALLVLVSKNFIPRGLVRGLAKIPLLMRHPWPLFTFAGAANYLRMLGVAWDMLRRGELTRFKIRQYGNLKKIISQ